MTEIAREAMEYDVVIVGAGPAGLSAAIRLKQLDRRSVGRGAGEGFGSRRAYPVGRRARSLPGSTALMPDWQEKGAPINVPVKRGQFLSCWARRGKFRIPNWPMPPLMSNHGNYIVSMAQRLPLDGRAGRGAGRRDLPRHVLLRDRLGRRRPREGRRRGRIRPQRRRHAGRRVTSRAWNCWANMSSWPRACAARCQAGDREIRAVARDIEPQKFGLGMKEIWEIDPAKHREGTVTHTMGWPLGKNAGGGSFIYHLDNNQVYVGFVVHLNYQQPLSLSLHGIPALQASPDGGRAAGGRQARRLWRAGDLGRRLAVDPEGGVPGRRRCWAARPGW